MNLIAVFAENKPGQTARISGVLAEAGINLRWLNIVNSGSFGVMKFLADKTDAAVQSLRQSGLLVSLIEVLAVEVPNRPGGVERVASCLAKAGLNLDNCSGFVMNDRAILIIETPDKTSARGVLEREGLRLLGEAEMLSL